MPRSRQHAVDTARRLARRVGRRGAAAPAPHSAQPELPSAAVRRAARAAGWRAGPTTKSLLVDLQSALDDSPRPPRVLLLAGEQDHGIADIVRAHRPKARVLEVGRDADPGELHVELAASGPFDLVVDDTRRGRGRLDLFERTFFHLRSRGTFLMLDFGAGTVPDPDPGTADPNETPGGSEDGVLSALARLSELRVQGAKTLGRHRPATEANQARTLGEVVVRHSHVVVRTRQRGLPKLREEQTNALLERRGASMGRLLHQTPPATFEARSTVVETSDPDRTGWAAERLGSFSSPALSLREYVDPVCGPGQLISSGGVLLTDSYRHLRRALLQNRNTAELNHWFAVPREPLEPTRALTGSYFYLDSEFRGHFGHAMTEQLSRLWAWQRAKRAHPDLKVLVSRTPWGEQMHDFERLLYGTLGVGADDYVLIDEPVRVERVLAATPMFSQPTYVHPGIAEVWETVGDRLEEQAPERDYPRRFFCGRSEGHRACLNNDEVERLFIAHGFEVVYPERYPLPEQVRMFSGAEAIAGYSGSVLFNTALTRSPKHVISIASESYSAKNEHLISAVVGHHLHLIQCRPEFPIPEKGWSWKAFGSDFTFDLDREGRYLVELLETLEPL